MSHPRPRVPFLEGEGEVITGASEALLELGSLLRATGYSFVTPTPATHARVLERARQRGIEQARNLRDVFGWSMPFVPELVPWRVMALLAGAGELSTDGGLFRSRVRFSSLGAQLYVHSAYPTVASDSVFFGPDTYRFCALVQREAPYAEHVVDLGCGSGAGGICIHRRCARITLVDINPRALKFSGVNAQLNGVEVETVESDLFAGVPGTFSLVISNPPYLVDPDARLYRNGGGTYGSELSLRIVRETLPRLRPAGTLILYTGSAVVQGVDTFLRAVVPILIEYDTEYRYEELDPDVFGEELEQPAFADVERVAAVALRVRRAG